MAISLRYVFEQRKQDTEDFDPIFCIQMIKDYFI